jgi:hypothetical protein
MNPVRSAERDRTRGIERLSFPGAAANSDAYLNVFRDSKSALISGSFLSNSLG